MTAMSKPSRRHPAFVGRCEGAWRTANCCSQAGAGKLGAMIKAAWAAAGHDIRVEIVQVPIVRDDPIYTVRLPDLVNGLPVPREPGQ